jgi:hypothetical protein
MHGDERFCGGRETDRCVLAPGAGAINFIYRVVLERFFDRGIQDAPF